MRYSTKRAEVREGAGRTQKEAEEPRALGVFAALKLLERQTSGKQVQIQTHVKTNMIVLVMRVGVAPGGAG